LRQIEEDMRLPPKVVEAAFLETNPEYLPGGVTVTCRDGRIQEVRICLTKDLEPRICGRDVQRDCSAPSALFSPIR
ncbi:MAG: ribonuclease T, partial [Pseudomonadota bacterium]